MFIVKYLSIIFGSPCYPRLKDQSSFLFLILGRISILTTLPIDWSLFRCGFDSSLKLLS